jgi:hypothetical protein
MDQWKLDTVTAAFLTIRDLGFDSVGDELFQAYALQSSSRLYFAKQGIREIYGRSHIHSLA